MDDIEVVDSPSMDVGSPSTPSDLSDIFEDARSEPFSERDINDRRQSQPSRRISDFSDIDFPPLEEFIVPQLAKLRFVEVSSQLNL